MVPCFPVVERRLYQRGLRQKLGRPIRKLQKQSEVERMIDTWTEDVTVEIKQTGWHVESRVDGTSVRLNMDC